MNNGGELRPSPDPSERPHPLVGPSRAVREVLEFISKVAPTNSTVLILGESGTGKELVARAIHGNSSRCPGPYVPLNCAAVPEDLFESEFFGFEKGAFTGALERKKGKIEWAHGGTLFLDEVGEMKASMQVKLLRVLEERQIQRVGGLSTIRVDIRVIAATNRDLLSAVARGEFREDLYYRLKVLSVTIPALRERPEDILPLALHFVSKYASEHRRDVSGISPGAGCILTRYEWPGNVRELEHVIEAAVVLGSGQLVRAGDLPREVVLTPPRSCLANATALKKVRQQAERYAIENALLWADGDYKEASRLLEIHPRGFHRFLKNINRGHRAEGRSA